MKENEWEIGQHLSVGQSPKKLHEVGALCQLLLQIKNVNSHKNAFDVGSGQVIISLLYFNIRIT